jgi:lysophospholipase L1-like esterase
MRRILFFGDSICAGSNVPDGGADDAWPMAWSRMDQRFAVLNRSRGGRPTASLPEFREALASAGPVDVLVLALGGNDARDLDPGMVAAAVANLGTMVDLATEAGIPRVIIVGPYNINRERLGATYPIRHERDANLRALDAAYRVFADGRGLEYLPMYGVVPEESLVGDGVHPDRAGNLVIARHFAAFMAASPRSG